MKSQTRISATQSQNQQQPVVPIQQLFQNSSQTECKSADSEKLLYHTTRNIVVLIFKNILKLMNFTEF